MARMYHQYFGLNEAPFSIAVNPRYLFMSARHRDALAHLLYGVGAGGGFILLTGEVGTGKTTINRCLLEQLPHDTDIAIILNPALNAVELLATACDELGISYDSEKQTLKTLTDALHRYLLENHALGRKTVLMIDEAQHLDFDVLEQIRLLTNLETNSEKLLQIILIGQPELAQMLARPELRQLNQRITARYNLGPLNLAETGAYIHHRLQVAGLPADRVIFPPSVVRGVYKRTRGIPRLINVLCDRVMLGAYGRNKSRADLSTLRVAAREVLGEEGVKQATAWPWALAALVLIGALAAWWGMYSIKNDRVTSNPASSVDVQAIPAPSRAAAGETGPVVNPPATAAPVQPAEPVLEPVTSPDWLLPPDEAETVFWSLHSGRPKPEKLCEDPQGALACLQAEAATWDELATQQRPLLLHVVTPDRFAASVILLGIDGRRAWVGLSQGVEEIALAELGPYWSGGYQLLWQPPPGFARPLSLGDSSEAVTEVASLFARLDGQQRALASDQFNQPLQQRVMIFQREMGLQADGVVGIQTLLKLNEALGIDVSASQVRLALQTGAVAP